MKALDIANAFIVLYGKDDYIANTRLNKLVYFAYAEELRRGHRLFDDKLPAMVKIGQAGKGRLLRRLMSPWLDCAAFLKIIRNVCIRDQNRAASAASII